MPPEIELISLIDQALLADLIDQVQADLAYTYLRLEACNHDCLETH